MLHSDALDSAEHTDMSSLISHMQSTSALEFKDQAEERMDFRNADPRDFGGAKISDKGSTFTSHCSNPMPTWGSNSHASGKVGDTTLGHMFASPFAATFKQGEDASSTQVIGDHRDATFYALQKELTDKSTQLDLLQINLQKSESELKATTAENKQLKDKHGIFFLQQQTALVNQKRYEQLSKDYTQAKADSEYHQKQHNELLVDYDHLKTQKGELEAQHLRELGSYNDDLSNAKLDLITIRNKTNEEMDILKEQHTQQKKNMQAKHDAEMQKKIAELQFTMQNQSGKAQDDLMNKHAEDKHALELAHIKEVSELANRHNTERGHLTKNYTEASQEVQTLKSERAALKKTHEEEKAQLNLQIMKVHEERASILQERSQAHQKEIEDLQHSTSESHQKQLDDLDDKLRMEMETLSEGYEKQKQEDIKRLQDEYEVKISGFKKTMEESMNFITKKNTDQEELQKRNIELIGELDKSKSTKQQLSENLTKLQTNYQSLQAQKEKEITELNNTKAEVIKNYDAHIAKTEGELKAQLQKDRADALSIIETQTRNCQTISNKLVQQEKRCSECQSSSKRVQVQIV